MNNTKMYQCKLCRNFFPENEMSDEHYPARCVGNDDIVSFNVLGFLDDIMSDEKCKTIKFQLQNEQTFENILNEKLNDSKLSKVIYPKGRTRKTLCNKCNTFLGKYDEAYLKFFNANGSSKTINGFQKQTKYQIIKSIFAKFLSVPETEGEKFDFIDFIKNEKLCHYEGKWNLYLVKRDSSSDLMGLKDIGTGVMHFKEGVVYELSDDKFIFNLMNFKIHSCYKMTNIFEILNKNFSIIEGVGEMGGYHGQILFERLLSGADNRT